MKQTRYIKEIQQRRWVYRSLMGLIFIGIVFSFCYWLFPLPEVSKMDVWLTDLDNYGLLFNNQEDLSEDIINVRNRITNFDLDLNQLQTEEDIGFQIDRIRLTDISPDIGIRSDFNILAADALEDYFNTRKELKSELKNTILLSNELENCRADIPEGGLTAPPH